MWEKALNYALGRMIRQGNLTAHTPDGALTFGDGSGPPVTVRIEDRDTVRRLVLNPELAFGEGYMDGRVTIDNDDLRGLMALAIRNMEQHDRAWWQKAQARVRTKLRALMQTNLPGASRRNVAHHYDLSGELYDLFLDEDRQYSCAYFDRPDATLEDAQAAKKAHIARKLALRPGMRVLDIGCGWGGMALTLARDHGARVLGITLSEEQLAVARSRAEQAGLADRVEFRLLDYRRLTGRFDRIVSVGMFEHVGLPNFNAYFRTVRDRLSDDGVALIHTIGNSTPPGATNPWIAKYIFPGGYIPSLSEVVASIEAQDLWVADVETLRLHYALTLKHWIDRFEANADRVRELYDERFVRMWRFYLVACEQTFRERRQGVFQFQITRKIDALPITRNYLYAPEAESHDQRMAAA